MIQYFHPRDPPLCLVFFTRLPLPHIDFGGRSLAAAMWAAPLAGAVVAATAGLIYWIAAHFGVAAGPASALAIAAGMLATGCLHEDGLSDVADGFGGGKSREKKLEIMRDSRIGAYGACALGVSLLIRWSALSAIIGPSQVFLALLAAHAASRGLAGPLMHMLPPARPDGASAGAGRVSAETALAGAALGALSLMVLGFSGALTAAALLGLLFFAFQKLCRDQIGGQTGDTVGALQQLAEMLVLVVASACLA